jgi:hypothetical protein
MPSLQTNVWGPPKWLLYHLTALVYPNNPTLEDKLTHATRFIYDWKTLPCNLCVQNVPKNLESLGIGDGTKLPTPQELADTPYFDTTETQFYFLFQLHNQVNKMLGKPVLPLSEYDAIKQKYQYAYAKSSACAQTSHSTSGETGCTVPESGYKPCRTQIQFVPRSLQFDYYGPAFYFDDSLQNR